mmetsp:Transcript_66630/g.158959  ORF Transcript_66630/g.158959 Transcript_66630/m.158959 type:complete len:292 (-) Transcript_66630:101-976(-)
MPSATASCLTAECPSTCRNRASRHDSTSSPGAEKRWEAMARSTDPYATCASGSATAMALRAASVAGSQRSSSPPPPCITTSDSTCARRGRSAGSRGTAAAMSQRHRARIGCRSSTGSSAESSTFFRGPARRLEREGCAAESETSAPALWSPRMKLSQRVSTSASGRCPDPASCNITCSRDASSPMLPPCTSDARRVAVSASASLDPRAASSGTRKIVRYASVTASLMEGSLDQMRRSILRRLCCATSIWNPYTATRKCIASTTSVVVLERRRPSMVATALCTVPTNATTAW